MGALSKGIVATVVWSALVACSSVQPGGGTVPPTTDSGPPPASGAFAALRISDGAGAEWRIDGQAVGAGEGLQSLSGHNAFWFAWSVFHPGTTVFGRTADIAAATIAGGAGCTVPCDQITPACGGRDCIPSLESPTMVPVDSPELAYLRDSDEVLGVVTSTGPRAYPHNILWWHEIVNEAEGADSFAITFCPLTGSGIQFDRTGFVTGSVVELGVSGNLYNSNLTMYDRTTESFWSQMRVESVFGPQVGTPAPIRAVFEMTWQAWRELHPDTVAISSVTGHARNYQSYPYGDYRSNHGNTFRRTDPLPDGAFDNKAMTFGLFAGDDVRAYPWQVLEEQVAARRGVVADTLGGVPVAVVFDLDARYVHAFDRRVGGTARDLALTVSAP